MLFSVLRTYNVYHIVNLTARFENVPMNGEYVLILTLVFSLLFLIVQRTERKYRRTVFFIFLFSAGILLRNFVVYRSLESEAFVSLSLALLLNFLFWILIGRYNPVGSSDDNIQVLGMDD